MGARGSARLLQLLAWTGGLLVVVFAVLPVWIMVVLSLDPDPVGSGSTLLPSALSGDQLPDPVRPGLRLLPGAGAQPAALAGHDGGQPAGGQPRGVRPGPAAGARRGQLLAAMLAFAFFPGIVVLLPMSLFFAGVGLLDTLVGIGIAQLSFTVPLAVWFLAYAFRHGAARGRGGGPGRRRRRRRPSSRGSSCRSPGPGVAGTTVLVFVASWNDFVFSSNLNRSTRSETLPVLLAKLPDDRLPRRADGGRRADVPAGRARGRGAAALAGRPLPLTRRPVRGGLGGGPTRGRPVRRLACRSLKSCRGHTDVRAGRRPSCPSPVVGCVLALVLPRLLLVAIPASADESGFLMVARQWHPGGSLYGDYWVDRPPLLVTLFRVPAVLGGGRRPARAGLRGRGDHGGDPARPPAGSSAVARVQVSCAVVAAALLASPLMGTFYVNGELLSAPFVGGRSAAGPLHPRRPARRPPAALVCAPGPAERRAPPCWSSRTWPTWSSSPASPGWWPAARCRCGRGSRRSVAAGRLTGSAGQGGADHVHDDQADVVLAAAPAGPSAGRTARSAAARSTAPRRPAGRGWGRSARCGAPPGRRSSARSGRRRAPGDRRRGAPAGSRCRAGCRSARGTSAVPSRTTSGGMCPALRDLDVARVRRGRPACTRSRSSPGGCAAGSG